MKIAPRFSKKTTFFILLFLLLFPIMFTSSYSVASECKLVSSWEPWSPYQYLGENGKLKGLDIELIVSALRFAGCNISFIKMPWHQAVQSIKSGEIDVTMSASKTPEREKFAYFSEPYRSERIIMYVRKGESKYYNFTKLPDILGSRFRLGTVSGYYYGTDYENLKSNPISGLNIHESISDEANIQKLMRGEIDGFLIDPIVGGPFIQKLGIADKIEIHPMSIQSNSIYVMFSKKTVRPELVHKFNQGLYELRGNGAYDFIVDKYTH